MYNNKIKIVVAIILFNCFTFAGLAFAQELIDVSGEWEITLQFSLGNTVHTAIIEQDGEELSGVYKGQHLEGTLSGTIEGNKVDFIGSLRIQAKGMRFHFIGIIEGDTITMQDDYTYDEMNVDWSDYWRGEFTAKRKNSK